MHKLKMYLKNFISVIFVWSVFISFAHATVYYQGVSNGFVSDWYLTTTEARDAACEGWGAVWHNNTGGCLRYNADGTNTFYAVRVGGLSCTDPQIPDKNGNCIAPPNQFSLNKNDFNGNTPYAPLICKNGPSIYTPNPINTTDGNKTRLENDFTAAGISPLSFTRYYNSNKNHPSDISINWRHNYTSSLTENIHTQSVPYIGGDSNFSTQYSTAQAACESGWNDIKGQFSQPLLSNSSAIYNGTACTIQNGASPLGSIAVRSSGGVSPNPPQDTVVIERANGNTIIFTLVNSIWTTPSDTDVSLIQTTTGYTLTTVQDTVEEYNLAGQLVSITTRKGIQQTLTYNATTNALEIVIDSFGNTLNFAYAGANLSTVTLPDNKILTYSYDGSNNLTSVKREDDTTRTYHYEDTRFANALTGITNGNGERHMTFSYDASGRATTSELAGGVKKVTVNFIDDVTSTVTDALGQLRTYRFTTINGEKRLTDIEGAPCSSCGGQATHTTYDANGYVASSTDFNGNVTTFVNNARGLATTRTEATGTANERVITTVWHATYSLPLKITQAGNVTDFTYDANGNVLTRSQTDTSNNKTRSWTYTYNTYGQVLSVDGARTDVNDLTTYAYDVKGNLIRVTNALGHVTNITAYDARNKPLTLVDVNGLITQLAYDERGRVISRTVTGSGISLITTFTYDGVGNLKSIHLSDGRVLNYNYDAAHRLVGLSDQVGNRFDYTLDALGNRLKQDTFDPSNTLVRTRTQVFNMLSQLVQSVGVQNQTSSYGYDANGNRLTTTDATTATTTSAFDALNRVISVTDPLSGISTYSYDTQGNLASVEDANGSTTSYVYDGFGNRINQSSPDTGITTYSYDAAGNALLQTDAKAQTTSYSYDVLNRLTQTTYSDGRVMTYTYDQGVNAIGRLTQIQNAATIGGNSAITYGYDVFGRMINKVQTVNGLNLTTAYAYDTQGRMSQMTYPSGRVVAYSYLNGQLNGITVDNQTLLSGISYQAFGSVSGWNWGNGRVSSRGFDLDGQLISLSLANDTRSLSYDVKGNIRNINDSQVTQLFGYDELNRLTAANDSSLNNSFNQTFAYDANGNRLSLIGTTATDDYTYESMSNRLVSISGSTTKTYQYDLNGNIINDGLNAYTYDSRNRLVTVTYPQECPAGEEVLCGTNIDDANYQFNALGQRIVKKANNKVPNYVLLNTHYQQVADAARLQATSYTEQANSLLAQVLNNETQAQALNEQAAVDRTEAQSLNQQADLLEIEQQSVQAIADELYASAADYQALIVEPTTSFFQSLLNSFYQAIVNLLTVIADAVQAYADNLAQQVTDLRLQADTLITNATATEQKAITLLETAAQNKLDAANLQTLAAEQTTIADAAQVKANDYQTLLLSQPRALIETVYAYNEAGQLIGNYDAMGTVKQEVIYLGNLPVAVVQNNVIHYIHTDHLATPRVITDVNNTIIWSWMSDPFGKTAANEDPDGDGNNVTFNLRFAGQYYDQETGLHYNYFRDYDPSTGRYVQSDPIGLGGGLNTYGYVGGNPLYWIDPLGLAGAIPGPFGLPLPLPAPSNIKPLPDGTVYTWDIPGADAAGAINSGLRCVMFGMCNEDASDEPKQCDKNSGRGRPWTGEPNSTTEPNKGGDSRRFGKDGLPEVDYDAPHPDERYPGNAPHAHNWDRPSNGGPPTAKDRGPSLPYSPIP